MKKSLSASQRRSKYLRADLLQPADVILIRSRGSASKAIARLTSGDFSHATIVIASTLHFESDGAGVGYTRIGLSKVEQHHDGSRWFWNVADFSRLGVFRHPDFNDLSQTAKSALASRLIDILHPFAGFEYPSLDALAGATTLLSGHLDIKQKVLRIVERLRATGQTIVLPGPFCSQLVALAFRELGHSIFQGGIEPEQVNPNLLADSRFSCLRPVDGVLAWPDPRLANDDEGLSLLTPPDQPIGKERSMARSYREVRTAVEWFRQA